jgi:hypothetical protein
MPSLLKEPPAEENRVLMHSGIIPKRTTVPTGPYGGSGRDQKDHKVLLLIYAKW